VDSFLCDRLGAGFATDPSTASRTQLGAPEWDQTLLDVYGVPRDPLPKIMDTAGDLGTLSHPSWPVDLPLRARTVDQQAAPAGARPSHIACAALEGIAWRVADVVEAARRSVPVDVLRVDGGLTRDPTLLQLQADTTGVSVQRGAVDATVAGAAALAAVGAGIWGSTLEIAERIPIGERTEPQRDDAWRQRSHAEWREFVERAGAL